MNPNDVKLIGKWQVVRMIGQGGMSWVFEVVHPTLGYVRAVKMLKPAAASAAGYKSFLREAQILAKIDDEFLVGIEDFDKDPETGNDYYVMELLSGRDLKQQLKLEGPLTPERAIEIFSGVLQALGKLHAQSPPIIHRDIKPGNIQITAPGQPKLLDLGIAKVTRKTDETVFGDDSTVADMFKGTVLYASPEHLAMQEPGPQSDVFAIGLCMYEVLEGRHAYADVDGLPDPTNSHVSYQDVFRFYTRLEAVRGELKIEFKKAPKGLQRIIRKALEIEPANRFRDANEMRDALLHPELASVPTDGGRVVGKKASDLRPSPAFSRPRPEERALDRGSAGTREGSRRWVTVAGGAAVAACLAAALFLFLRPKPPREPLSGDPSAAADIDPRAVSPESSAPTAEQTAIRESARRAVTSVENVSAPAARDAAAGAQMVLAEANDYWAKGDYVTAVNRFSEAAVKAEDARSRDAGGIEDAALRARAAAEQSNAALNAPDEWRRGAERLQASAFDEAREAFAAAKQKADEALESARSLQRRAEATMPVDCDALAGNAKSCNDAKAKLAQGRLALEKLDANAAAQQFQSAMRAFDPIKLPQLTLTVTPLGPIELEIGKVQRFEATASDANATVTYRIQPPGAEPGYSAAGSSYAFVPKTPGAHRISVVARDAQRRESAPITIAASVREKAHVNPRPPQLTVTPNGKLETTVGMLITFQVLATDPDGGKPGVGFSVNRPKQAPELPKKFQESGDVKILPFTPTEPGTYTFSFVAFDLQGLESPRVGVTVVVRPVEPTPTPVPKPISTPDSMPPLEREVRDTLQLYAEAWQSRDVYELQRYWAMNPSEKSDIETTMRASERIIADINVIDVKIKPSGKFATVIFEQKIESVAGTTASTKHAGRWRATMARDAEGWVITVLVKN